MPDRVTVAPRTTSEDYGDTYFKAGLGSHEEYAWESPHWRSFFTLVADRVAALLQPMSVLDVGCARGLLVQALAERGVDAHGIDISEFAVQTAHADIRPRLRVASAVEP